MVKGRFAYTFESGQYTLATDLGFAQLARSGSSDSKSLGTEVDLHLNQKWYDNFSMNYALGFLVPGEAFNNSPQTAWAVAIRGALTF